MKSEFFPYLQHDGFIAVAHRGGGGRWPENSMRAFEGAIDLGFHYIETDVHVTRDGVLLAFHDEVLNRVTDSKGKISEMDYMDVRTAKIGGNEPIPRLQEALDAWPQIKFNIDPKSDAAVEPLCRIVRQAKAIHRVCIGSFSGDRINHVRKSLGSDICTSMGPLEIFRLRLAASGFPGGKFNAACAQVATHHYGIPAASPRMVRAAHANGLQIHVWTVDDVEQMARLIDVGVDGLMTDRPERLKQLLQQRGLWV